MTTPLANFAAFALGAALKAGPLVNGVVSDGDFPSQGVEFIGEQIGGVGNSAAIFPILENGFLSVSPSVLTIPDFYSKDGAPAVDSNYPTARSPGSHVMRSGLNPLPALLAGLVAVRDFMEQRTNPDYLRSLLDDQNLLASEKIKRATTRLKEKGAALDNENGVILYFLYQYVKNSIYGQGRMSLGDRRIPRLEDCSEEFLDFFPKDIANWRAQDGFMRAYVDFLTSWKSNRWIRFGYNDEAVIPLSQFLFFQDLVWPNDFLNFIRDRKKCSAVQESMIWQNLGDTRRAFMALTECFLSATDPEVREDLFRQIRILCKNRLKFLNPDLYRELVPITLSEIFFVLSWDEEIQFQRLMIDFVGINKKWDAYYKWRINLSDYCLTVVQDSEMAASILLDGIIQMHHVCVQDLDAVSSLGSGGKNGEVSTGSGKVQETTAGEISIKLGKRLLIVDSE